MKTEAEQKCQSRAVGCVEKKGNEIALRILTFGKPQAVGAEAILSVYPWLTVLSITLKSNKC